MQKMKANNLPGIERHNKRIYQNHSNEDIDNSLSYLNYDVVDRGGKYQDIVKEIIDSQKEGNRAIRKDAVLVNEWIITSDKTFFKDMSSEERDRFFKEATDWFKERYGQQNIAYAQVHLDESTPHMHLGVVPMREGKLQAKNVFNRQELRDIQEELPKHLKDQGFEIERGKENSERKHLNVPEYKEAKDKAKEMAVMASKTADFYNKTLAQAKDLSQKKKALEGEIERNQELVIEYSKRSEKLTQNIPQDPLKKYRAKMPEPIYQPAVKQEKLFGRTIKMDTEEYNKMLSSQQKNQEHHEMVAKNFNALADLYYKSETEKRQLAAELEKATKAIPVQNEFFVPASDLQQAKDEIREKDKIIEDQKKEINVLKTAVFKCAEFIRDKQHEAFDLMKGLAKHVGIVGLVNKLINQENEQKQQQEREQKRVRKKQKGRDDLELY